MTYIQILRWIHQWNWIHENRNWNYRAAATIHNRSTYDMVRNLFYCTGWIDQLIIDNCSGGDVRGFI